MRCFVAVEPSPAVRDAIAVLQESLRRAAPDADVRWTAPAAVHLTLAFLGEIDAATAQSTGDRLAATAPQHPAPALIAQGGGAFPDRRRPKIVWVGVSGDGIEILRRVHADLRPVVAAADDRPFAPHLTIGRVRSPRGASTLRDTLASLPFAAVAWTPAELVLYRSHLQPGGAVYEPLARAAFATGT